MAKLLGGAHEFQAERGHDLPANLWVGPQPATQARGPAGIAQDSPAGEMGISADLAMPAGSRRSRTLLDILREPWRTIMYGIQRKGDFIQTFGVVGLQPIMIRAAEARTYFILQNTSLANTLLVGIGYGPVIVAGGATGFLMQPNGGNYEPAMIPQGDIWVSASGAGTQWVMAVCTG